MFKIEIKTGGSAFRDEDNVDKNGDYELDYSAHEVRRILKGVIAKLENGYGSGKIMDINGNHVGEWKYN